MTGNTSAADALTAPVEQNTQIATPLFDRTPDCKISTLNIKLNGSNNYPEWVITMKLSLQMAKVGSYRAWDIVEGTYRKPPTNVQEWQDGNNYILLIILKNCEAQVRSRIGTFEKAKDAWNELKKAYEGRTITKFHALLDSLYLYFDDRQTNIADYIATYEKTWNTFTGIINKADLTKDIGFGRGLLHFSKCDQAKTEFLFKSLPPYYSNTMENIRAKDYSYDDAARKLREYITARQQQKRPRLSEATTNKIVNNTEKKCNYCIGLG